MNNESLKNYMLNEYDYLPDTYVIEDAEKRELLRELSLMITDRRDKKKLEDIVDNDPEMWCLDKIMNKDEVKFMLSFEKKRVNKFNVQQLAKRNSMTPEQAQAAVARYRERYLPVGIYECTLYPGIPELLERLRAHGFRVAVATGKPTPMACSILQRFDLERLFDCVIGCEYDGTRSTKAEVVAAALAETQTAPEAALMVGDRKYDVTGAAACGVPCLGVYYGYAEPGELEAAGAAHKVNT